MDQQEQTNTARGEETAQASGAPAVLGTVPLGFQWPTIDPFLFCVHHLDAYPKGNAQFGPDALLAGRNIGQDFEGKDGWRMYHGAVVPGFPGHPHRGFETVTIARRGYIDHSDSLGAAARFGRGDVQWLTAGKGIVHSEMFPLLNPDSDNTVELFQIWMNLPAADKMVDPHFKMFWAESIPVVVERDAAGKTTEITVIAGAYRDARPLAPPPKSWAARPDSDVAIWSLVLAPGARFEMPAAASSETLRLLYVFGGSVQVAATGKATSSVAEKHAAQVDGGDALTLIAGEKPVEILMLQGRPIDEPVAQQGPFVMNTAAELQQAFADYRRTQFGGWPWKREDPVHVDEPGRFARHADGTIERFPR
jgi:hypothetical protein